MFEKLITIRSILGEESKVTLTYENNEWVAFASDDPQSSYYDTQGDIQATGITPEEALSKLLSLIKS